jgi:hypothetical protein
MTSANTLPDSLRKLLPSGVAIASTRVALRQGQRLFLQRQRPRNMYFAAQGEA